MDKPLAAAIVPSAPGAAIDEFTLIRRYFQDGPTRDDVALGIGDDAALLRPQAGCELVVTTDTLVGGRHFPDDTAAHAIGWKSLAVNLSDLAAMAAQPCWFLLALTLPVVDESWLRGFASGLREMAGEAGMTLVGGDTTRGPLAITITALGQIPTATALRRSGAQIGDWICVTGTLGDAALGLALTRQVRGSVPQLQEQWLRKRLDYPSPRVLAGLRLRTLAHAAIDLSDGLAGDLEHVLQASGVGADIEVERLPMSPAFAALHAPAERLRLQAAGGDDYELCVCIAPERLPEAQAVLNVPLTPIGRITAGRGLRWLDGAGRTLDLDLHGYDHFLA